MKHTVTRKQDASVSVWGGGSTAQLFIYPPLSSYANRDFEVRISAAVVEEETSAFTRLPGYHRILMPLTAPLRLVHEGHGEVLVNPMEVTEFEGEWHTVSHGVCSDLGVMLAAGWRGTMEAVGRGIFTSGGRPGFTGFYALAGGVEVTMKEGRESFRYVLARGDFLLAEPRGTAEFGVESPQANAAVLVRVFPA